jgi:phosphoribosylglycinamide formyltransferase 1
MTSAVILISGRGSNMRALVEAGLPVEMRAVIANRPGAAGLEWAASRGIATRVVDHTAFASRAAFDAELAHAIDAFAPDLVLLAGFMRILTEDFVARYPKRMLNIHPSLLPLFPGLDTHRRALEAGVKLHGATVHFVTPTLDHGPILVQAAVPVLAADTEATLADRVLVQEHLIYPQAVRWLAEGRVEFLPGDVVQVKGSGVVTDSLVAPRMP